MHEILSKSDRGAMFIERMAQGGDRRAVRDEIAALHLEATAEKEYAALLEAHRSLVAVEEFAYGNETYIKLLPVAAAEYRMFLNKAAMELCAVGGV